MRWPIKPASNEAVLRPDGATTATPVAPRSWEPEIDSLVAVEVICAVEELLGIKSPRDVFPEGRLRQRGRVRQ